MINREKWRRRVRRATEDHRLLVSRAKSLFSSQKRTLLILSPLVLLLLLLSIRHLNPNPNPKTNRIPSKSWSPTTPSPLLVIGKSPGSSPPSPTNKTFDNEVVEKRVRVSWESDKAWYEGKHLIQYNDAIAKEEELDLVEETRGRFKRLRRGGCSVFKRVVIEFEGEAEFGC
ncbi:hypothetical protein V6N13_068288 [Hibiscus sabdariffa]|uniref:Uncharacterized protein n=1 Tax=Hibiscus sabdariffa TaxID=183260 RepID=A0ABR2QMA6_9ROSI